MCPKYLHQSYIFEKISQMKKLYPEIMTRITGEYLGAVLGVATYVLLRILGRMSTSLTKQHPSQ
jgi:hypothetical protein